MRYRPEEALAEHQAFFAKALDLVQAKRVDYSGTSDPFANFRHSEVWNVEPWRGAAARLMDKISRLSQLFDKGDEGIVKDEAIADTVVDALNYLVITYQLWNEQRRK